MYIDAQTGEALFYNATIKHFRSPGHDKPISGKLMDNKEISNAETLVVSANAATRYSGTQIIQTTLNGGSYILSEANRGNGIHTYNCERTATYPTTNFTDADNNWTAAEFANANKDNGALDAHWGAEMTYDYWLQVHGRNSFDNAGGRIDNYVHFNLIATGYPDNNNAFWNGTGMTYCDGNATEAEGSGFLDILTSLDIIAHEIGHAICTYTADLVYQKESGALNEGFSDIWSAAIESRVTPTKSIWESGEDIDRRIGHLSPRSMSDPKREGYPDTYGGTYWINTNNCTPTNNNDLCGVHYNGGVLSHWFYILSVGKTGTNDIGSTYNVTGITIEKAAKIAYRIKSVYLTSNSNYAAARLSGIQSAIDLYGVNSPEVIATTNAFYAVGVGPAYSVPNLNYCASQSYLGLDEKINKVAFGTINNFSIGIFGYENFSSLSTDVQIGTGNTIKITPSWSLLPSSKYYSVFIDYNQDGDFTDTGETAFTQTSSTSNPVTGTITIPLTAQLGNTRMRISMKQGALSSPCENSFYGDVEDYSINIIYEQGAFTSKTASELFETTNTSGFALYPNPVVDKLNISFLNNTGYSFVITNTVGQPVIFGELSGNAIDVTQLNTGIYLLELNNNEKRIVKKFTKK